MIIRKVDPEKSKNRYWGGAPLPTGCRCLGAVTRPGGFSGALVENHFGILHQAIRGWMLPLSQTEARAALHMAGRPGAPVNSSDDEDDRDGT